MAIEETKAKQPAETEEAKRAADGSVPPGSSAKLKAKGTEAAKAQGAKSKKTPPEQKPETWKDWAGTFALAIVVAMVVRSFLFQPFNIPSESMKPTLLVGDFLFVSKYSYGYSKHSLPLSLPLIPGRIFFSPPHRGDVVVFKTPSDNRTDYIKRVIGLPGDTIQMRSGVLYLNGKAVKRQYLGPYHSTDPRTGLQESGSLYRETLPNGMSYETIDLRQSMEDNTGVFHVPPGHYFMMGDNRDNSADSRIPVSLGGVGYVPAINLVGKAQILFFSVRAPRPAWEVWKWFGAVRYGRILKFID
jgi:signal peptidase I